MEPRARRQQQTRPKGGWRGDEGGGDGLDGRALAREGLRVGPAVHARHRGTHPDQVPSRPAAYDDHQGLAPPAMRLPANLRATRRVATTFSAAREIWPARIARLGPLTPTTRESAVSLKRLSRRTAALDGLARWRACPDELAPMFNRSPRSSRGLFEVVRWISRSSRTISRCAPPS